MEKLKLPGQQKDGLLRPSTCISEPIIQRFQPTLEPQPLPVRSQRVQFS